MKNKYIVMIKTFIIIYSYLKIKLNTFQSENPTAKKLVEGIQLTELI